jgi:hypothetical protein
MTMIVSLVPAAPRLAAAPMPAAVAADPNHPAAVAVADPNLAAVVASHLAAGPILVVVAASRLAAGVRLRLM